jgi:D-alanyl-D-alanine carboxypeptidase (penicillin-binding protein 5/6)
VRLTDVRPTAALALTLCVLVGLAVLASPAALAAIDSVAAQGTSAICPSNVAPPPPVDTSEALTPGETSPTPLPAPSTPVGGTRMGECGAVLPAGAPALPTDLAFTSWVIADLDTGQVLAAQDPHARERPASLIKLLLALVASRELNPATVVTGTQDDANQQGTRVGVGPGGQYTNAQLVHALLMDSGNDVAHALAMQLGGMQAAVTKMNALASQLGATDTRAATPSGLDGAGMSTSSYDLMVIFRTALRNPLIADAVHTTSMQFPGFPGHPGFAIYNDNPLLTQYPGDLGGKTGYTDDAMHTYANAADQNGHRVALIAMHGTNHLVGMYANAKELMSYGFQLENLRTQPVGQVVSVSLPPATSSDGVDSVAQVGGASGLGGGPAVAAVTDPPSPAMSAFGTVGMPLTVIAAIIVGAAGVLYWRRRKAKLARLARLARGK